MQQLLRDDGCMAVITQSSIPASSIVLWRCRGSTAAGAVRIPDGDCLGDTPKISVSNNRTCPRPERLYKGHVQHPMSMHGIACTCNMLNYEMQDAYCEHESRPTVVI